MEIEMIEAQLALARRCVTEANKHIAQQRQSVAALQWAGRDYAVPMRSLKDFLEMQRILESKRDRLMVQLAAPRSNS